LFASDLDEIKHLLGNAVDGDDDPHPFADPDVFWFDTGVRVAVGVNQLGAVTNTISLIVVDYNEHNKTAFHFDGIDGNSTYADVVAIYGNEPHLIREGSDERRLGAVKSYGYWVHDYFFVNFFSMRQAL